MIPLGSFERSQGGAKLDSRYQLAATVLSGRVATLPGIGSSDGATFTTKILAANSGAASDVRWNFQYDVAAGYWYFIGGAPYVSFVAAGDTTTNTAYVAPGTVQELVVPYAGDYLVAVSAIVTNGTAGDGVSISYAVGGTAANDAWDAAQITTGATFNGTLAHPYYLHTGLAAGDKIAVRIKVFTGGTATVANRLLNVLPLRVH